MFAIGSFSLLTGLSIAALRHYDETGVLPPAQVDPVTGYRRYAPQQLASGRSLAVLRGLGVPVDDLRRVDRDGVPAVLHHHRDRLLADAQELRRTLALVDRYLEEGLPVKTTRISQVTIVATDLAASIDFYRRVFGAEYHPDISSFQFGTYPDDEFFLLTVADPERHPWSGGPAKFGLSVDDVDAVHGTALGVGGTEVRAPHDEAWKPRSSTVQDPAGNHVDLYATS